MEKFDAGIVLLSQKIIQRKRDVTGLAKIPMLHLQRSLSRARPSSVSRNAKNEGCCPSHRIPSQMPSESRYINFKPKDRGLVIVLYLAPDLTPLSSTCAPWRPCVAFQQFLSGVFSAGVRRSPGRAQPLMTGVLSRAIDGPLVRLLSDHTL